LPGVAFSFPKQVQLLFAVGFNLQSVPGALHLMPPQQFAWK
jgi:hypothetical protein